MHPRAANARRPRAGAGWLACVAATLGAACGPGQAPRQEAAPPLEAAAPSEDAVSRLNVGVRRLEQFRYGEAAAAFTEALRLAPGFLPARVDLAIAHLNALEPASTAAAKSLAAAIATDHPGDARALYVQAYVLSELERDFAGALPHLRRVTALAPADPFAAYLRARSADELAREAQDAALLAEAESEYRRALALDATFTEANYRLGRLLLDAEDPARQAEGEAVLLRHQDIVRGRPSVQQNYLTRGELARAYPWSPGPAARPEPAALVTATPTGGAAERTGEAGAPPRPAAFAMADIDGDAEPDLLVPGADAEAPAVRAAPLGLDGSPASWAPLGSGRGPCSGVVAADLDRDGDSDVALACDDGVRVLAQDSGAFAQAPALALPEGALGPAREITVVDVDHDGDLDLCVAHSEPATEGLRRLALLRNDGAARFTDATEAHGLGVTVRAEAALWSDLDGDNAVDLVVEQPDGRLAVLLNARSGAFTAHALGQGPPAAGLAAPARVSALDVDADADLDLIEGRGGDLAPWINESAPGSLSLARGTSVAVPGAALHFVADLDLDGWLEVVVPADSDGLLEPAAAKGFPVPLRFVRVDDGALAPEALAAAEVAGAGRLSLVGLLRNGQPAVLRLTPAAPFAAQAPAVLRVRLAGREGRSNPHGLGAKLTQDSGRLRQHVEVRAAQSPRVNVLLPVVLGIGARATSDGLTVLWPSGIRQAETDLVPGAETLLEELDRQPSSCPMLYGWDGERFAFLTDCFDTAPLGLWVAPGVHWSGAPAERLRLREGSVRPEDGVVTLAIAEFLNESLLADHVGLLAVDAPADRRVVVDEGVRLAAPPAPAVSWSLGPAAPPLTARQGGEDVTDALAREDRVVAGWRRALPFVGLAEEHAVELDLADGRGVLVLTGSLNFSNSTNLFAAHQAGIAPLPVVLERREGSAWRQVLPDAGAPAGFHKDVVVDLRPHLPSGPATVRFRTNLQVSWDRAAFHPSGDSAPLEAASVVPLLRAEKRWLGVPREVKGQGNRWREFPRDGLSGASDWVRQAGPTTPDGDVSALVRAEDGELAFVRPGEEIQLGFDVGAVAPPPAGAARTLVLVTFGWVKDADPHTALSASLLPLPVPGRPTYP